MSAFNKVICSVPCFLLALLLATSGCRSPSWHHQKADRNAYRAIETAQQEALGHTEPFTIEKPSATLRRRLLLGQDLPKAGPGSLGLDELDKPGHWPESNWPPATTNIAAAAPARTVKLGLLEALQVAARNSRSYQAAKETLFEIALDLDLANNDFRTQFAAALSGGITSDRDDGDTTDTSSGSGDTSAARSFANGMDVTAQLALDLTDVLTGESGSSLGLVADASISIPLMRGSGRHIIREGLTQAERNTIYGIYTFEEFKRSFVVEIASEYLSVLRKENEVFNSEDNYTRLQRAGARAEALAKSGRVPAVQVDQARQDELRARNRTVQSRQAYESALDSFKVSLGLPPDASVTLDAGELGRLGQDATAEAIAASSRLNIDKAVRIALETRPDMRTSMGRVADAQRAVVVAADSLRAELTLLGSAQVGQTRSSTGTNDTTTTRSDNLSALVNIDLPINRTAERVSYRKSLISLEKATRNMQQQEDSIKLAVRGRVRTLSEAAESIDIQRRAVELAERRQESTTLFIEAGRAEMRDLLEAQEALLSARNALASALVSWRVALLELQREIGILQVNEAGLWRETSIQDMLTKQKTQGDSP